MNGEALKPEITEAYQGKDIVVVMKSTERISFKGGNYRFVKVLGTRYLLGKGMVEWKQGFKQFDGKIALDEIEKIEMYQFSSIKTSLLITAGAFVVFLLTFPKNIAH